MCYLLQSEMPECGSNFAILLQAVNPCNKITDASLYNERHASITDMVKLADLTVDIRLENCTKLP